MNGRQWQILATGAVMTVAVMAFGMSHPPRPIAGPIVEHAPGQYSRTFTEAFIPQWALLAALGLAVLTGAFVYRSRGRKTD